MGVCGSKAQAMASDTGNRMSRAFKQSGSSSDLAAAGAPGASPRKGGRGRKVKYTDTPEYAMGLPEDPAARQKGCYFVFDSSSNGMLQIIWSETEVLDAWAFFFPRADVPGFKYKNHGGKSELIRGIAVNKEKLYSGWKQFIKLAHDYDGLLQLTTDRDVDLWFMDQHLGVHPIARHEWFEIRQVAVLAILPRHNQCFKGVQRTNQDVFTDTANKNSGTTWKPLA